MSFIEPLGAVREKAKLYTVTFIRVNLTGKSDLDVTVSLWYASVGGTDEDIGKDDPTRVYDIEDEKVISPEVSPEVEINYSATVCVGPFTETMFLVKIRQETASSQGMCAMYACGRGSPETCLVDLEDLVDRGACTVELDQGSGHIVLSVSSVRQPLVPSEEGIALLLCRGWKLPDLDWFSLTDARAHVVVLTKDGVELASATSRTLENDLNPIWDQILILGGSPDAPPPAAWDIDSTSIEIKIEDDDVFVDDLVGTVNIPLRQLIESPTMKTLLYRQDGAAQVASGAPHEPSQIAFSLLEETKPRNWIHAVPRQPWNPSTYPRHIFMMTRGTRGDVQPFVALARGMAEMYGWLVTICTELRWRDFVKSKSNVERGRIRFRPSGGDTEAKMAERISQWALSRKSEVMQMIILANSEANFFDSSTVFLDYIEEMQDEPRPVDLIICGLTVVAVAAAISEALQIPVAGFILQPTCIPSKDKTWKAVQAIDTHVVPWVDWLEGQFFTSHRSLAVLKRMSERNPLAMYNINHIRDWLGLERQSSTWGFLELNRMHFVIPIRPGTFPKPDDWWDEIVLTDFIFLRDSPSGKTSIGAVEDHSVGDPVIDTFLRKANAANTPVGLMSFSSMPVARSAMLKCATRMIEGCKFNMRLIYVGKRQPDSPPQDVKMLAERMTQEGRFLEVERADFGKLFKHMQFFIIQGGLGTTVEALRIHKPIAVSGPLLLDQRFWGQVVHEKGVGPPAEVMDRFLREDICVKFVNDALDPSDPEGYQARARETDWGQEGEDGVQMNCEIFKEILESGGGCIEDTSI